MKLIAALGLAWLFVAAPTKAQPQPLPKPVILPISPPTGQSIAVALDESARLSVPVTIGGRLCHFLIDTASTRSVIASDVADSLDLPKGKAMQILNIGGIDTVQSVTIPELGFSDFAVRDIVAPSLARSNLGGDGLLGLDMLRNKQVTIDFRNTTVLTITPSSRKPERSASPKDGNADPETIIVVARSRMGELIVTNAEIDGIAVAVIIDTGSQDSIGNPALARLLLGRSAYKEVGPATLISVTGRTLPADYAVIGKLRIGGVRLDNVPMAFGDIATFKKFRLVHRPAILLGMHTLRLFAQVTIDFPRHEIRFLLRENSLGRDDK